MGSKMKQTNVYFAKFFRLFLSTAGWKVFIFAAIISGLIAAVVGGDMFEVGYKTETGCFALVSACIWIGIFNSIQEICKERDIIKREYRSGLYISSYIRARARYELFICAVQALIMVIICGITMDVPSEGLVFGNLNIDLFFIFFILLLSADYLGIVISCIVKTTTTAMTVMPFVLIIQLVLSGVLFPLEGATEKVASLTISKWGMKAMGAATDIESMGPVDYLLNKSGYPHKTSEVTGALGTLILFAVLYLIIGGIFLKRVDKDKR